MAPKKNKTEKTGLGSGSGSPATRNLRSSGRVTRSTSAKLPVVRKHFQELPDTRKQPKRQKKEKTVKSEEAEVEASEILEDSNKIIVVIEHCKQCNSFKTRANQVKEGLEKSELDIAVKVNPEKPRKGCFEIRLEGGKQFISLLDLKRPFQPMKDLDMEKVISDIIDDLSQLS